MKSLSSICFSCQHGASRRARTPQRLYITLSLNPKALLLDSITPPQEERRCRGFTVADLCRTTVIHGLFTGEDAAKIEALLLNSITAPEEGRRLAAAQWALRLFDFRHVPARYVCVLAAGDGKLEVKEAGASGLKPPRAAAAGEAARICFVQLQHCKLAAGAAKFEAEDIGGDVECSRARRRKSLGTIAISPMAIFSHWTDS